MFLSHKTRSRSLLIGAAGVAATLSVYAQTNAPTPGEEKDRRITNIIKKNLEATESPIEEMEKIIIEGAYDPEDLPKKKKTVEQKLHSALNPFAPLAGPPPIGYQVQCIEKCKGPFCCAWVPGPRSYLMPDSVHK